MYAEGKKHGFGKYVWADKSSYEGYWEHNAIHGKVNIT